jgi:two-component system NtrC family response regulator
LPQFFPAELLHNDTPKPTCAIDLTQPLPELLRQVQADVERDYIRKALEQCHGNVSRCAQMCGISRRSLSAKLSAYQINKAIFKDSFTTPVHVGASA